MLEVISPAQFIEGINESVPLKREGFTLDIRDYPWIAFQHTAQHTYSLEQIDIGLEWRKYVYQMTYKVNVLSDYLNYPTDIVLSKGKFDIDPNEGGFGWSRIELEDPIILVTGRKYWIGIETRQSSISPLRTQNGTDTLMRVYNNNSWESKFGYFHKIHLKCHGRLIFA